MSKVNPIPAHYPRVSPYLAIEGAAAAIDFYRDVFGATQRGDVIRMPDGKIGHAELELGGSMIMLSDAFPDMGVKSPIDLGGSPVTMLVYVDDVDDVFDRALEAGAKEISPVKDQFYGDRTGQLEDPWGHRWNLASHIEDVPAEEMQQRAAAAMGGG